MSDLAGPVPSTVPRYPIRVVAARVGVSELTLRAWERRYAAVEPARSGGGQRAYSDADVERLTLFRTLTLAGATISALAPCTTAELRELAGAPAGDTLDERSSESRAPLATDTEMARDLAICKRAIVALDADRLYQILMRLVLERGTLDFLADSASPLCGWIGDEWSAGRLTEAQEHSASEVLRRVFGFMLQTLRRERRDRHVVLATLAGERHEFGAMMAAIVAAYDGWSYSYLGADLPAGAIATAVKRLDAKLVALSIVAPQSPTQPARELVALRRGVGRGVDIVVGGPQAALVDSALQATRATRVDSLRHWRELLAAHHVRAGARP